MVARPARVAALLLVLLAPRAALAVSPVFHGVLEIRPASGPIAADGTAALAIHRWTLWLGNASDGTPSNGIHPATEPIVFAIGEQRFLLPAGTVRASHDGTRFRYVRQRRDPIRSFRIWLRPDGSYGIRFAIRGIELSALTADVFLCRPAAVIIGDDDGFVGLGLERRNLHTTRFRLGGVCDVSNDWPWIQG